MIEMRYQQTITKQGYHNGLPLFKEDAIGVPFDCVAYAVDSTTALSNFHYWTLDAFRDYRVISMKPISEDEIPKDAWVFSGYQQGFRHDPRPRLTRELYQQTMEVPYA